ncbi:outer membrane protein with beta-barrel domain [Anseongella ginsenosidimutans]|uniref:Outer membrane protein with beta-barrel domain n=1 Tax=Anseongella ginsenosidimutans TaxID=496056 RepID=A0A4R3KYI2_9SPHI|nr:DUF6089 family protein [Anseongella ginsenosidimutans]QEC50986.1 outer membrane beta-barrel protein [Anseongella ginsenosidimutans]TCS90364.1 outer membrane protein with beta-barrel domain [Anseongella ginsenosidimutans]
MPGIVKITGIVLILLLSFGEAGAQKIEVGLLAGGSGYMGDLNTHNYQRYSHPALGALLRWNINPRNSVKFSFLHGTLQGSDATSGNPYQESRNLYFRSPLNEFSVQFEFNFFRYNPLWGNEKFSPYLFTGISVFSFDPEAKGTPSGSGSEEWYRLRDLGTEGQGLPGYPDKYKLAQMAIPIGIGVKFNLGRNWNLTGEMGYRPTFTDFLDDVSGYYPDPAVFETTDPPAPLSKYFSDRRLNRAPENPSGLQRGDLLKKDTYLFAVIGISYTFVSSWCPAFSDWGRE